MSRERDSAFARARRTRGGLVLLALALLLSACGASAQSTSAAAGSTGARGSTTAAGQPVSEGPAGAGACGAAAGETLARTAGRVAIQIYDRELASTEVRSDQHQVENFQPLLSAMASGDRPAIEQAVTSLVFSHTHVVRLRVSKGSTVLADVGGPYIIAPVGGTLRFHGSVVGHYVLSVQDDLGYVKLETRFIGAPLVLHRGSARIPVEGTLAPGPASIPEHGPVTYHGVRYQAFSFDGAAFPSGTLRISLLVPLPAGLSARSCTAITMAELEHIAQLGWRRFVTIDHAPASAFVDTIASYTGGPVYVRAGSRQLAGSTHPGPPHLPVQGTVRYHGIKYTVSSFAAAGPQGAVRVYLLARS